MDVHTNIPFKNLTTMQLGGTARFLTEIHTADAAAAMYKNALAQKLPVFILGGGSNVIARDEGFNGIIMKMRIPGFDVISDDLYSTTIRIGAGEEWDSVVKRTVDMRLSGIEAMSAIPGTAGATPVQNVGAYGQDISDTLVSLEAYDTQSDSRVTLLASDCGFSYRDSIFRGAETGRYIICSITIKLSKSPPQAPFYEALQKYFDEHSIEIFTQQAVRDAVIAIRADKLPDPKVSPNTGSFFKNAVIDEWLFSELKETYPTIPHFDMGDGKFKVPTGWLIEQSGFKGKALHGMKVNDKNCLVLINESAKSYADLAAARDEIISKVRDTFRITIEQEPLEI